MACCVQWRRRLGACFAGSSGRQSRWQRCSLPLPPDTRRVNRRAASQTRAELPVNVLLGDPKKNRGVFLFLWHTSRLASRNMVLVSTTGAHSKPHSPHLPPNSAGIGYVAEGALCISALLSTDAVSALQKVWVLINIASKHAGKHGARLPRVKKEFRLD